MGSLRDREKLIDTNVQMNYTQIGNEIVFWDLSNEINLIPLTN
jgi:hypothetical protein